MNTKNKVQQMKEIVDRQTETINHINKVFKEVNVMLLNNKLVNEDFKDIDAGGDTPAPADNVNHPKHYEREGAIECIDEMIMLFGKKTVMEFCKCNAWKYRYRAADKNGEEDIKKSDWYMRKYKELAKEDRCTCHPCSCSE